MSLSKKVFSFIFGTLAMNLTVAFCQTLPSSNATGAIAGVIVGDDGKSVPGAKLVYTRVPQYSRGKRGEEIRTDLGSSGDAVARADGTFALSGLQAGQYHLCAQGPKPSQLSDCMWDGVALLNLAVGQNLTGITRRVHEGTTLTLRISDPASRIQLPDSKGRLVKEKRFFPGVFAGRIYAPAKLVSATPKLLQYRVTIPKQRSVRLFIDSELEVVDITGKLVETRTPSSIQISSANLDDIIVDLTIR